jgi:hypothetical protein
MDDARARRIADYTRAVLRVPELGLVLRPQAPGQIEGTFPFDDAVHVVTAADPGARRFTAEENAARQARLEAELDARGLRHWATVAGAEDGSHAEAGALVVGLDDDAARALGAAWGQDAVFRWSRAAWTVVACDDAEAVDLGWRVA